MREGVDGEGLGRTEEESQVTVTFKVTVTFFIR